MTTIKGVKVSGRMLAKTVVDLGETVLLLNFNGTNGATTTTDSSIYNVPITLVGGSVISTAQSKFGGSSLFQNTQDQTFTAPGVQALGTGDFCLQGFFRQTSTAGQQTQLLLQGYPNFGGANTSYDLGVSLNVSAGPNYRFAYSYRNPGGTLITYNDSVNISLNVWYHFAMTRKSGTMYFFRNGTLVNTAAGITTNYASATWSSAFNTVSRRGLLGYIDSYQITKGYYVYDASFTPPIIQPTT